MRNDQGTFLGGIRISFDPPGLGASKLSPRPTQNAGMLL